MVPSGQTIRRLRTRMANRLETPRSCGQLLMPAPRALSVRSRARGKVWGADLSWDRSRHETAEKCHVNGDSPPGGCGESPFTDHLDRTGRLGLRNRLGLSPRGGKRLTPPGRYVRRW